MPESILSFKLGPVQPFIESARTLRDLWSGSYLLSWLVAHAMKPLIGQQGVKFITPSIDLDTNELLRAAVEKKEDRKKPLTTTATLACLPHTFAAMVPLERAEDYKKEVLKAIDGEWKNIASVVHDALDGVFHKHDKNWDTFWKGQVDSYFEFRVVVLPHQANDVLMNELGIEEDDSQDTNENKRWGRQWNFAGALLDMARSVKHVPEYKLPPSASRFPVKCSLFGTFEQMGPADFQRAKDFWKAVESPTWPGIEGTRLHSNDKLCAISLIKRFAWPVYWSKKLGLPVRELRFLDTATMAAADWLEYKDPSANPEIKKIKHWEEQKGDWNGQWLHWPQRDTDEPHCPEKLFDSIKDKKRDYTAPPTYYALLMLDGDNMGDVFQGDIGKPFGNGLVRFQKIAKQLTSFGLEVKRLVETEHNGELIYSGGDDVLAFLPTTRAVDCAKKIREAFEVQIPGASLSGGIAVVHYKEDLRFALGQVRSTEKAAKGIGKKRGVKSEKDAFAITICKRSGEHSTVILGWGQTKLLQELVTFFKEGATDRWVYKLREEMPTLVHLGLEASKAETLRLVNRGEFGKISKTEFVGVIGDLFDAYKIEMKDSKRNWEDKEVLEGFVGLCQSASFLARGKE